jgi:flagellar basal-body rod modification protein FlgD
MQITADRTSSPTAAAAASLPKKELGKDDFLRLLTVQLTNQDPLKPVDNTAFIAQLAQFSSLEQLHNVGSSLETLLLAQASSNQLAVTGLVGKDVLFRSEGVDLADGATARLTGELPQGATVTAAIQDASGRTVRTLPLGELEAGRVDVVWDGHDDRGERMPAGHYGVVFSARASDGTAVTVDARARGRVQGVSFGDGGPLLLVGGERVTLSDVLEITTPQG